MTQPQLNFGRRSLLKGAAGLSLAALVSAATTACNSSGGSSSKTLKLLYFGEQSAADELEKRLQPEITKLDPGITFEISAINGTDWNDFLAKVLTQVAAGTPPDLISVATEGLQLMAQKELAVPLDDYVTKDMADLKDSYFADVHPALIESMMYEGHLWELTDGFNAGNMYYNTTLFEKAGVEAPADGWTLDDFENAAAKTAAIKGINGFGWVVRLWGSWTSFMYANNANLLEEGKYDGGDWLWNAAYAGDPAAAGRKGGWKWGAPTANSPGTVEALEYMIELNKKGLSPKPDVGGGGTLQGLFASNRIGMAIGGGFWAGGLTNAGMKNGSFDVQLFPKWKSQRHLFGAGGYAIFKTSKQKDLAWEVIKLLVKPETFDIVFPGNVTTPARKSLMTAERYAETGPKNWSVFYDTLTDHPDTMPIPAPPYYNALATALNQRTTQAMSSGDARAALDGLQSDLEKAAGELMSSSDATAAAMATAKAAAAPRRRRRSPLKQGEAPFGFLMIGLAVLFVAVFTAIPIFASFLLSFTSWDVISPPEFVGLKNYQTMLTDGPVLKSFGVTIGMATAIVVLQLTVGLVLAVLVNQRKMIWLRTVFRTAFYLPLLASTAAVSIFMGYLFDYQFGVVNYYLGLIGIPAVPWLNSPLGAATTIVLITVWQQAGFTFVLFVAALMAVPTDVLEASQIDGASALRTLLRIKIPLISPTILFAAVIALINAMQLFDQPYIMTKGGPGTATTTVTIAMYQKGFQNLEFGYGSAIAIGLLAVILAFTGLQFLAARKLVFYQ